MTPLQRAQIAALERGAWLYQLKAGWSATPTHRRRLRFIRAARLLLHWAECVRREAAK